MSYHMTVSHDGMMRHISYDDINNIHKVIVSLEDIYETGKEYNIHNLAPYDADIDNNETLKNKLDTILISK